MKIIEQSFRHLPDSDDLVAQIGNRARICYQSEPKDNETAFVNGIIKKGHNSCLEMGVVHLRIEAPSGFHEGTKLKAAKYLTVSRDLTSHTYYCTGSIRAFREFMIADPASTSTAAIFHYFKENLPDVFSVGLEQPICLPNSYVQTFNPKEKLPTYLCNEHTHVAMQIVTNRAVTHELVRHRPVAYLQESQRYVRYNKPGGIEFIDPREAFPFYKDKRNFQDWQFIMETTEQAYVNSLNAGASPQAARIHLPNSTKTEIIMYCSLKQWEHILNMRHSKYADPSMQELMEPMFNWFVEHYPEHFSTQKALQRSVG